MYENENGRKIYPLPLKVNIRKSLRMFLCGLLCFIIACGMVIFSCYFFANEINLETINVLDDLIFSIILLIFAIYMFNCLLPCRLIVDDEKLQIDRILYKRTFYWNEISGLYTFIFSQRTIRGIDVKQDNLQVIFYNRNDKRTKLNIGIPWEIEYKSETIKNTIWYAYAKYHPECNQSIE